MKRCEWADSEQIMRNYHDTEWGVPIRDDRLLFEFLILEGVQAGLSWSTVLKKRDGYRKAFYNFDANKIIRYVPDKFEKLMSNTDIIRNRLKINATIINARAFLEVQKEYVSFNKYIWQFTGGKPISNNWRKFTDIPATSPESDAMSKDMKQRGFKFVGSTICYAFMQAVGIVNDHTTDCFRYTQLK